MRLRGLCKLPNGRDWRWEKRGLALVDRALLSKAVIQLSDDRCGCIPSPVVVCPMVGLMANSKRVYYAKGDLSRLLLPVPRPCGKPLLTHISSGNDPTVAGSFGSVSCGVTAPLLWVSVCAKFCLCPPRLESLFPSVFQKD